MPLNFVLYRSNPSGEVFENETSFSGANSAAAGQLAPLVFSGTNSILISGADQTALAAFSFAGAQSDIFFTTQDTALAPLTFSGPP